jgi:HlyD family secretion protein
MEMPKMDQGIAGPLAQVKAGPHRGRLAWRIGSAFALLVLIASIAWLVTTRSTLVRYTTAPIGRGAVTRAVSATGTVNPVLTIIVGTYVSGVIQRLFCDYNTQVKEGQVCAKIDPRPYQAVVDQDKANLAVARAQLGKDKANLGYAEVNFERNAKLAERQFASQDAADNAKSLYQQAQAQVVLDQATIELRQAELEAAQVNLGYTDIVSPVNGTVVSRNVTIGQTVAATFQTPTLFLIATDLTQMEVDTNVSESDIGAIKDGNTVRFTVDTFPNRVFQGAIAQVRQSPQTVQNVVTYDVVVNVDNADLALKPGMTASVQIVTAERTDVLRVADQALRYVPAGSASTPGRIWLLRDGRPTPASVTLGLDDDTYSEIVQGEVRAGDQAITGEQHETSARTALPTPRL